jgi:hypothetical protein
MSEKSAAMAVQADFHRQGGELADAPDLGIPNHRFQNIPFHFKTQSFYEWKTPLFGEIIRSSNDKQKHGRSSTTLVHGRTRL